ncbi:SH3 domain-containing protein [uncultured Novosphingobium sp.]|uniref:SH3 domain-containing protein n=1 Tax=uncultured Novosphingobium sp. TaxID=292277 RepID=UPI0025871829|nr:SH3 domain-containing protein [uncultured Novosphingobium sp.]
MSAVDRISAGSISILEKAALGRDLASRFAELDINRNLHASILASQSPALQAAAGIRSAMEDVNRLMRANGILDTIVGAQRASDEFGRKYGTIRSVNEAIERSLSGYREAFAAIERFGSHLAGNQTGIVEQIAQLSSWQSRELANRFAHLEMVEWTDEEPVDQASEERLQAFLVSVITHIATRLNPVNWGPGEYMAIIFYILALYGPAFTDQDRAALAGATIQAGAAHEEATLANDALYKLGQAEAAHEDYVEYVSKLPRGIVISRGNVREEPRGGARQITFLPTNASVAVAEQSGRWLKVIYKDELTERLEQGWIWRKSVSLPGDN